MLHNYDPYLCMFSNKTTPHLVYLPTQANRTYTVCWSWSLAEFLTHLLFIVLMWTPYFSSTILIWFINFSFICFHYHNKFYKYFYYLIRQITLLIKLSTICFHYNNKFYSSSQLFFEHFDWETHHNVMIWLSIRTTTT